MSTPLVSAIIPTYNRAALLREAVESVLAQTYSNIEIVVIDAGSVDDTEEVMRSYGDRVRYSRRANANVNAARNVGIKQARGAYLAFLDNDDLWAPYKIELQVRLMEHFSDLGFVFSNFQIFHGERPQPDVNTTPNGLGSWFEGVPKIGDPYRWQQEYSTLRLPPVAGLPQRNFTVSGGDVYGASLFCPYVLPSTAMIRAAGLPSKLRLPEFDPICGDWEFFARLSKERGCLYVDVETAFNRSREDAVRLTGTDIGVQLERRILMIDRLWRADKAFYSNNDEDVDSVLHRLLLQAAQQQLFAARTDKARACLQRADSLRTSSRSIDEWLLRMVASLPGSGFLLQLFRAGLHSARRFMAERASRS